MLNSWRYLRQEFLQENRDITVNLDGEFKPKLKTEVSKDKVQSATSQQC